MRPARRRPLWVGLVALALLVVPLLEILVILQVGRVIGAWWTVGLLLAESALGAWIVAREGGRAWAALRDALVERRMPATQLVDAALVLIGGALLLAPGFITDALGFFFVLPFTRPLTRRWLAVVVERGLAQRAGIVRGRVL